MEKAQHKTNMEKGKPLTEKVAKVEELGQFGLYQLRVMLFTLVVIVFSAWGTVDHIFIAARSD